MKKTSRPRPPQSSAAKSAKSKTFAKPMFVDFRQLEHEDHKTRMTMLLIARGLVNDTIRDERKRPANLKKWRRRK